MCHVQLERAESVLQFHVKCVLENVSINEIQGHFVPDFLDFTWYFHRKMRLILTEQRSYHFSSTTFCSANISVSRTPTFFSQGPTIVLK